MTGPLSFTWFYPVTSFSECLKNPPSLTKRKLIYVPYPFYFRVPTKEPKTELTDTPTTPVKDSSLVTTIEMRKPSDTL